MKTRLFFTALCFLYLNVASINASVKFLDTENVSTLELNTDGKALIINSKSSLNVSFTISVLDLKNGIVKSETIDPSVPLPKSINLTELPSGEYIIKIAQKKTYTIQKFKVEKGQVLLSESDKKLRFEPMFKFKNNLLDIMVANGDGDVFLRIINEKEEMIKEESYFGTKNFTKRFDLAGLSAGKYTVELNVDGVDFYYTFTIEKQ